MFVKDLKTDFTNGLVLINLMEVISGKKLPKYVLARVHVLPAPAACIGVGGLTLCGTCRRHNLHPRITIQKNENLQIALNFIQGEGTSSLIDRRLNSRRRLFTSAIAALATQASSWSTSVRRICSKDHCGMAYLSLVRSYHAPPKA